MHINGTTINQATTLPLIIIILAQINQAILQFSIALQLALHFLVWELNFFNKLSDDNCVSVVAEICLKT